MGFMGEGKFSKMYSMKLRTAYIASLFTAVLLGQDAGMVLRTSVGYNTQKAGLPADDPRRKEADRLGIEAQNVGLSGKLGDAMRLYLQGFAVMNKVAWTPAVELAASLQAKADHAMLEPGNKISLTLTPMYKTEGAAAMTVSLYLQPVNQEGATAQQVVAATAIDAAKLPQVLSFTVPESGTGNYMLEARLRPAGVEGDPAPKNIFVKGVAVHVEKLAATAQKMRGRLEAMKQKSPTAEYGLALYKMADSSEVSPHRYDFSKEFQAAAALLDQMAEGKDPFAGKLGDMRKAYRSDVDNTLQPYRVFIPSSYDPNKPAPLVVALHGMGGDESSMFDLYRNGELKKQADRLGFIVVCPKGRDSASMYRGPAEKDVLDVLAEVRGDYKIASERIYLMGHSMGGFGTWSIAMNYPDLFAALGPFAGGGTPSGMAKIKHIPQYVVHGDNDKTVPVGMSRSMVKAGKEAGAKIVYVEVAGGSHSDVVVPQFAAMLDFFAEQSKGKPQGDR